MNALVWRLHRQQVQVAVVALGGLAVVLVVTGVLMSGDYHQFVSTCSTTHSCGDTTGLFSRYGLANDLAFATMAVPVLFGIFWGAPLLAREFEQGTHHLAWTQGVTRRRWLGHTVVFALAAAVAWGAVMAALVTWWRSPENALAIPTARLNPGVFDIQGIVPIAYSVFGVALGIAVGSLIRRVLPTMAVTLGLFVAVRVVVTDFLRPHYLAPLSKLLPLGLGGRGRHAPASWVLSTTLVTPTGQHLSMPVTPNELPAACQSPGHFKLTPSCLHGWHTLVTYQPASRFWAFQGIEAGIFVALGLALLAVTYRVVLTRDA